MTQGAQRFVTPLTFQAVSGHEVHTELWDTAAEFAMGHIEFGALGGHGSGGAGHRRFHGAARPWPR